MRVSPAEWVIEQFGGQTKIAALLGLTRQAIDNWRRSGKVPLKYITPLVSAALDLDLDVTYEDLVVGRNVDGRSWRRAG